MFSYERFSRTAQYLMLGEHSVKLCACWDQTPKSQGQVPRTHIVNNHQGLTKSLRRVARSIIPNKLAS